MDMNAGCRTALVTGAAGDIGSVLVERFSKNGLRVAAAVRDASAARAAFRGNAGSPIILEGDVTREQDVQELVAAADRELGGIDLLVNTVGGYLPQTLLVDLAAADWDRMMTLNLRSAFLCTREAIRAMRPRKRGVIVNFSAMGGLQPAPGRIAYAVAKAGIALLTRVVAEELRGSGIAVYAIAPAVVATPGNDGWGTAEERARRVTPGEIAEMILALAASGGAASGTVVQAGDRP
jgi:3-oxoacyl-[acyl-carrier protein] reductase